MMVDDGGSAARDLAMVSEEGGAIIYIIEDTIDPKAWEDIVAHSVFWNITIKKEYLVIDFDPWSNILRGAIKQLGIKRVSEIIAKIANKKYKDSFQEDFPLIEETIAGEIKFHIKGYMFAKNEAGYFWKRDIVLFLFDKDDIYNSCSNTDIKYNDINCRFPERGFFDAIYFRYRRGVRK
jgi:hypothetical protein